MKIAAEREDLEDLSGFQNVAVNDASELYISIGQGNRKIGLIPSWSLPQVETCNPRCLPHCGKECYSNRIKELYPSTWETWSHNLWMMRNHPTLAELLIRRFLANALPRLMRLHVAGDFYSKQYLEMWCRIAVDHPKTVFYGYSKADFIDHSALPENLRIMRSQWPGMKPPRQMHVKRNCWCQDGHETRIPKGAYVCGGDCPKCGFRCAFGSGDVVINLHR